MTQQNDLGAIQVSGQTEMALADELKLLVNECNPAICDWSFRKGVIVGLIDKLRPPPTEPDMRAAIDALKMFIAWDDGLHEGSPAGWHDTAMAKARAALSPAPVCPGGVDPGFDECPKCGATMDEGCKFADSPAGDTGREPVAWQFQALSGAWNDCGDPDPRHVAKNPHRYRALYASAQPDARIGREEIARVVYDAFPFEPRLGTPHKPAWLPGGNSLMQDVARKAADSILSITASAPAGGWQEAREVITAYFDMHGINDARAGAFNILDRLKGAGLTVVRLPQGPTDTAGACTDSRAERVSPQITGEV